MNTEKRDIVIAGGGMVGISLALKLASALPESVRIALVEGFALPEPNAASPAYHPSFDARSTALSYSSCLIYQDLGLWDELAEWLCPIDTIHVSSRGRFGSALMRAEDYAWPALGYVVENAWFGRVLLDALRQQGRVELINPARVAVAEASAIGQRLQLEGEGPKEIETALLLVADGAGSGLRQQLGVAVDNKPYHQHALIANVATAQPHGGCAFERFTDEGPLALLPLAGVSGAQHRSALVWTLPPERAESLMSCTQDAFLTAMQDRFGYRLGRFTQVGERHGYPLALIASEEQVRQGMVVMGNAAHSLHPVAGQGFNLALRDIEALATVLAEGVERGQELGELRLLRRYLAVQKADQERTIGLSDRLPELFMRSDPVTGMARDLGLAVLDIAEPLKREFVRVAAGVASLGQR
ncbi:MAG: 2-octaprenyl-6-methoxyphenyl hydroxylase [Pseudomonadota bacterium]